VSRIITQLIGISISVLDISCDGVLTDIAKVEKLPCTLFAN
jgi:hypothetical protein